MEFQHLYNLVISVFQHGNQC